MKSIPIKFRVIDADENCKFIELKNIVVLGYDAEISQIVVYDAEFDKSIISELYTNVYLQFYRKVDE